MSSINKRADLQIMEGADNNNCLPSDLWMSQIDPQFSGNLGNPPISDTRNMNSPTQLDLSMKQTPLYNNYDVPGGSCKQNVQAVTTSMLQPFATSSTRSAWEFASQNFSPSPKSFTSQNLSQPVCNTTAARFSQPVSDYAMHMSQAGRMLPSHTKSQSIGDFPPENVSMSVDFMSQHIPQTVRDMQNVPQTVRDMASQNMTQTGASDRSVWAHLYSLDPSLASYSMNTNVNQKPSYPQEKSYAYTLPHSESTEASARDQSTLINRSSILSEKPPLILGKLNSSEPLATSFMNMSSLPSESVSSFAPSLYSNVSGPSHTAKQSQPMDYEEQLGGYSPVSPPTHPSSPFSVPTSCQDTGPKHTHFEIPSSVSDMSSTSDLGLPVSQSKQSDPSLSIPLDVPLDMTKSWSSSQDAISITSLTSNYDARLSQPQVQNILPKDTKKIVSTIQTSDSSVNMLTNLSQKIAPKKSNFYGRDASYFSVPEESLQSSYCEREMMNNGNGNNLLSLPKHMNPNVSLSQIPCNSPSQITSLITSESAVSSNYDSTNVSFADSLLEANPTPCTSIADNVVSVNESTLDSNNTNEITDIPSQSIEIDAENIPLSQSVQKQDAALSPDCSETSIQKEHNDGLKLGLPDDEPVLNLVQEPSNFSIMPSSLVNVRGKAPRGRRRRGGGAQRRGRGKTTMQAQTLITKANELAGTSGLTELMIDNAGDRPETKDLNAENGNDIINPPASRPARGRKRKTKSVEVDNPDSETSVPRRSSNRRSKDNAMRLIELQAESVYSHLAKPVSQEPQQPTRARRKAAKAAIESNFDESKHDADLVEEKDSSSEEMSDEKDVDYAVDEDDVEALKKDELLDVKVNQKKTVAEKRLGGLKISIKLGLDSSAEIVSRIDEAPPRKKRKVVKKKVGRTKVKSKAIIPDDDIEDEDDSKDTIEKKSELESGVCEMESDTKTVDSEVKGESEEKMGFVDRHNSLMDKYFSSANSATLARQVPKSPKVKKEKSKQQTSTKSKATKNVKGSVSKTVNNSSASSGKYTAQDSSVSSQSNHEGDKATSTDTSATSDTGLPKFVCGYCPKRYHNKQALLSHMEGHMAEMEDDAEKTPGGNVSKDPTKKLVTILSSKKTESAVGKPATLKAVKKGEGSEELKFNCGECGKTFSSKLNLLDHIRTHTAEKPFECNLCHKCFKERDQLSVHRKVHAQEGLLRCPICSKGFMNNADLNVHIESHPKRSKPGQLPTKHPVPESLKKNSKTQQDGTPKPKSVLDPSSEKGTVKGKSFASALAPSSEKGTVKGKSFASALDPSTEKNTTKPKSFPSALDPPSDKNTSKGKSFASALEPSLEKNRDPVIVLRRNDGGTGTLSKEDSSKTVKTSKSIADVLKTSKEQAKKPSPNMKVQDVKKEPNPSKSNDQKPKSDGKTSEEDKKASPTET